MTDHSKTGVVVFKGEYLTTLSLTVRGVQGLVSQALAKEDFYRIVKMTNVHGVADKHHADDETTPLIRNRELSSSSETLSLLNSSDSSDSGDHGTLPISDGVYRPAGADLEAEQRQARDEQQKDAPALPDQSASATIRQVIMVLLIGKPTRLSNGLEKACRPVYIGH